VVAVASTYATEAGRVRVRCDGARITLAGGFAQPATGWAVRVRSGGPDQVRVRFARFDPAGWRTLLVVAVCVDQHPSFEQTWVDARPDGDRGDGEGRSAESGAGQHPNW